MRRVYGIPRDHYRLSDNDPYEPRDPGDDYDRAPRRDDYRSDDASGDDRIDNDDDPQSVDNADDDFGYALQSEPEPALPKRSPSAAPDFVSVPCSRCGYNLTGVAIGSHCPECGTRVDDSLYASGNIQTNGMAIASMVIGFVAMDQIKKGHYANASRGMAIAGLICSGVALLPAIGWVLMLIVGSI